MPARGISFLCIHNWTLIACPGHCCGNIELNSIGCWIGRLVSSDHYLCSEICICMPSTTFCWSILLLPLKRTMWFVKYIETDYFVKYIELCLHFTHLFNHRIIYIIVSYFLKIVWFHIKGQRFQLIKFSVRWRLLLLLKMWEEKWEYWVLWRATII
jgi:hypothetical protein